MGGGRGQKNMLQKKEKDKTSEIELIEMEISMCLVKNLK